jgi:hypothetical protein
MDAAIGPLKTAGLSAKKPKDMHLTPLTSIGRKQWPFSSFVLIVSPYLLINVGKEGP